MAFVLLVKGAGPVHAVAPADVAVVGLSQVSAEQLRGQCVSVQLARRDEQLLPAVTNVGRRPTFGSGRIGIEAHVLDFADALYGERLRLAFLRRLRDEQRFDSPEDLVAQVRADAEQTREHLTGDRRPEVLRGLAGF